MHRLFIYKMIEILLKYQREESGMIRRLINVYIFLIIVYVIYGCVQTDENTLMAETKIFEIMHTDAE